MEKNKKTPSARKQLLNFFEIVWLINAKAIAIEIWIETETSPRNFFSYYYYIAISVLFQWIYATQRFDALFIYKKVHFFFKFI